MLVAILGTTISPYLFFWQASEEVEKKKRPVSIRFLNGEEQRPSNFG
jgi:Mn2+/Fe2+ NRAMP family transporter